MKKTHLLTLIVSILCVLNSKAQQFTEIVNNSALTYYGIDFTKTKFYGNFSNLGTESCSKTTLRNKFMLSWNQVLLTEKEKYNLKKAYDKIDVTYELETTANKNSVIDTNKISIEPLGDVSSPQLTETDITKIIKQYSFNNDKSNLGLIFVADYFNKNDKKGCVWVVFFNPQTKNIFHTESFICEAGGIGLRNYWAKLFFNTIIKSGEAFHKKWKKAAK